MKEIRCEKTKKRHTFSKAIGIMALLIVMCSGVAAADNVIQVNDGYFANIVLPSQISSNAPFNIQVNAYAPNYYIAHLSISQNSKIISTQQLSFPGSNQVIFQCGPLPAGTYDLGISFVDGSGAMRDGVLEKGTIIVSNSASVPEFPSVAVPVAAILGLVVIFGRKKNMV